ncbi:MAG TPA: penicillin-binding protein [Pseudonocardia sp.]|nr:penicillin-binding protein [Pseudonocardia sp.]
MRPQIPLLKTLGAVVLSGVLLAAMVSPAAVGLGLLSNQLADTAHRSAGALTDSRLAADQMPLTTTVLDRTGAPLAYLYDQYRLPANFNQIADSMKAAIISIEDRRFYDEEGIDPLATLRAALHNTSGGPLQGASTITQQYVKNYLINVVDRDDPAAQAADRADTVLRKLREAQMAVRLDRSTPKNDILTGYLNLVEFAGNIYGVGAASAAYFHTTPAQLTVPQAALLAGMVNNPNLYNPYTHPQQALTRRNLVIDSMVSTGSLQADVAGPAKATPLDVVPDGPTVPGGNCFSAAPDAGFFCDYVVSYLRGAGFTTDQLDTGGYTIATTMDPGAADAMKAAVLQNVPAAQDGVANTFALVKPQDGGHQVVAMVANRNLGTDAKAGGTVTNIVSNASNVFGAGSSFKIFTTAAALEQGMVGFDSELPNPNSDCFTPERADRNTKCYPVSNDGNYADPISLQSALATSPNVAFVNLESKVGTPAVVRMAERLGLRQTMRTNAAGGTPITDTGNPLAKRPEYNQPQSKFYQGLLSFTLGVSPVSTLEMANVAATLMDGGRWCPPSPVLSVSDRAGRRLSIAQQPCEQAISTGLADTLLAGLSKDTTAGTSAAAASAARWTRPDIGKTGTTNDSESVAFVGGVNGYGASSMLFADGRHPRTLCPGPPVHLGDCGHGAFGGTVAAPPYFKAMTKILAGQPNQPIPGPDPAYVTGKGQQDSSDNSDSSDSDSSDSSNSDSTDSSSCHHKKKKKKKHSDSSDSSDNSDSSDSSDNSDCSHSSTLPPGPVLQQVVAPYTIGQQDSAASQTLSQAGYAVRPVQLPSGAPRGQVIGQSPQGNVPTGTVVTVYTSSGAAPVPAPTP